MRVLFFTIFISLLAACATTNYMGARMYVGGFDYVERWYAKPDNEHIDLPSGTAFYRTIKESKGKFIIRYYIADKNGSKTEIPPEHMWKVMDNGKYWADQDDDNLFYYILLNGKYVRQYAITNKMVAVRKCKDEWCELYPNRDGLIRYVKRSILYQGPTILNEKQKAELARDAIHVTPATPPWITPTAQACVNNGGEMNSRGVCQAKWKAANNICATMGGRLPTIGELKRVVIECGGTRIIRGGTVDVIANPNVSGYEACYRRKGFSYEYNGYFSSTAKTFSEAYVIDMSEGDSMIEAGSMEYPVSILCHEN